MKNNCQLDALPGALANCESRSLQELEAAIASGLPAYRETKLQVALALLEIHDRKLYRPHYRNFRNYMVEKWQLSRSRGYQLLHFARLSRMSTMVDANAPENERQARSRDAQGKAHPEKDEDAVESVANHLIKVYEKLNLDEAREFIDYIRNILADMERDLNRLTPTPICKTNPNLAPDWHANT